METKSTFRAVQEIFRRFTADATEIRQGLKSLLPVVFAVSELLAAALLEAIAFLIGFFTSRTADCAVPSAPTVKTVMKWHRVFRISLVSGLLGVFCMSSLVSANGPNNGGFSADASERWYTNLTSTFTGSPLTSVGLSGLQEMISEFVGAATDAFDVAAATAPVATPSDGLELEVSTTSQLEEEISKLETPVYTVVTHQEASDIIGRHIPYALYDAVIEAVASYEKNYSEKYPNCGITAEFLLATAYEESGSWWGRIARDGTMYPSLVNGSDAAGPFQFTGETWGMWYHDGNGDGFRDVQNSFDAAYASMRFQCASATRDYSGSLLNPAVAWNVASDYHDGRGRDREISALCTTNSIDPGWCQGENYSSRRLALYEKLMGWEPSEVSPDFIASTPRTR